MKILIKQRKTVLSIGLLVLAAGCIAYGAWGIRQRYAATHTAAPVISSQTVTQSTDAPDETPPTTACETYKVPASEPQKIVLPSLGVSSCVQKVGLTKQGAVAAPTNIHLAGWYTHSVRPGERGVSVIDGHVQGRYSKGIFKDLGKLRSGASIQVQLGSGQWLEFEVVQSGTYPADTAGQEMLKPIEDVDRQLTLITCTGTYDKQTKTYDKRVIVRAKLL